MRRKFDDDGRMETDQEYHRRIQDRMDEDSWIGRADVCVDFPRKAIVHEIVPPSEQEPPHIYRFKK